MILLLLTVTRLHVHVHIPCNKYSLHIVLRTCTSALSVHGSWPVLEPSRKLPHLLCGCYSSWTAMRCSRKNCQQHTSCTHLSTLSVELSSSERASGFTPAGVTPQLCSLEGLVYTMYLHVSHSHSTL